MDMKKYLTALQAKEATQQANSATMPTQYWECYAAPIAS